MPNLDPFPSIEPLDEAMKLLSDKSSWNWGWEFCYSTPKESYLSDSKNEWWPDDEDENFEEGYGDIFEVLDDEDNI